MSDLVGNPKDRFSCVAAQLVNSSSLGLPRKSGFVKPSMHINRNGLLGWVDYEAHFECHDIKLCKSPIKW